LTAISPSLQPKYATELLLGFAYLGRFYIPNNSLKSLQAVLVAQMGQTFVDSLNLGPITSAVSRSDANSQNDVQTALSRAREEKEEHDEKVSANVPGWEFWDFYEEELKQEDKDLLTLLREVLKGKSANIVMTYLFCDRLTMLVTEEEGEVVSGRLVDTEALNAHSSVARLHLSSNAARFYFEELKIKGPFKALVEVARYLNAHGTHIPPTIETPLRSKKMADVCKCRWDAEFITDVSRDMQNLFTSFGSLTSWGWIPYCIWLRRR